MQKQISIRINVNKIKKEWMFKGEKGTYLDMMMYLNDEKDQYGNNAMLVQSVPKKIRDAEKDLPKEKKQRGEILGNGSVFDTGAFEGNPGTELPTLENTADDNDDDLPF